MRYPGARSRWSTNGRARGRGALVAGRAPADLGLALVTAAVLSGCGDGDRSRSASTVRDSAGITIVENAQGGVWREGEAWRLSAEPVLDIGVLEGDEVYQLHNAADAVRLSDGRIIIANTGTHELRFYGPDGRHIRSVGRQGGGPGEFQRVSGLDRLTGDTVAVWDFEALRLSTFAPDGEFVRSVSVALAEEGFGQQHHGTFRDGSFVLRPFFVPGAFARGDGLRRDTTAYSRYSGADGTFVDTVTVTPGVEAFIQSSGNGLSASIVPFARGSHLDVHGDHAYVGVSDRYEIQLFEPGASLTRIIRVAIDPAAVTDSDVRLYAEENAAHMLPPQERDDAGAVRRMVQTIMEGPRPETFPMFDGLLVDDEGALWVREHERPGAEGPRHSAVFDADGRLLGTVQTPRGFEIFQIGQDFVLGRTRDDFDIEHIRLYQLSRSPL